MSDNVLGNKDVNAPVAEQQASDKDVKSMEYHRQVFQSKMVEEGKPGKYVSPSDNIMSPCTAKINALRNKHAAKSVTSSVHASGGTHPRRSLPLLTLSRVKPKFLFAQASAKKLTRENALGDRPAQP